MHRMNTGIVGYFGSAESIYIPNLSEFLLSFGVLSGAGLIFFFLVERFYVFTEPEHGPDGHAKGIKFWTRQEAMELVKGPGAWKVLVLVIVVLPLAILGLRNEATGSFTPVAQPVIMAPADPARGRTAILSPAVLMLAPWASIKYTGAQ